MEPTEPSEKFVTDYGKALENVLTISYLAGMWFAREKAELDDQAVEEVESSELKAEFPENFFLEFHIEMIRKLCEQVYRSENLIDIAKLSPVSAIKWLKDKLGIKTNAFIERVQNAVGAKVEVGTQLAFYDNAEHLTDFVTSQLESGEGLASAIRRLGKKDLLDKIGITDDNPYYIENVVRTNQVSALNAGMRNESLENEAIDLYRYVAIDDARTSEVCRELNGLVREKEDDIWDSYIPPNNYQCRSRIVTITELYAEAAGIKVDRRAIKAEPLEGFANDPSRTWNAPTKDMRQRLADHLGVNRGDIPKGARFEP